MGFLAHLLSLLVKGRENLITRKPEASNPRGPTHIVLMTGGPKDFFGLKFWPKGIFLGL